MTSLYGQNQRQLLWEASIYNTIRLELPFAHTVVVSTTLNNRIQIDYKTEGEYQNHLILKAKTIGESLVLKEQQGPNYEAFHDKLSAHKVWASTLKLLLPEGLKVQLSAQMATLDFLGNFSGLAVQLNEGAIELKGQEIPGNIQTNNAHIRLQKPKHKVFASSKYGTIKGPFSPLDQSRLSITSVEGNISLISDRK